MNIVLESIWVDRGCFAVAGVVLGAVLGWLVQARCRQIRRKDAAMLATLRDVEKELEELLSPGDRPRVAAGPEAVLASLIRVEKLLEAMAPPAALDGIKTRAHTRQPVDVAPTPRPRSQEEIKTKVLHVTPEVRAELARGVRR